MISQTELDPHDVRQAQKWWSELPDEIKGKWSIYEILAFYHSEAILLDRRSQLR